MCHHLQRAAGEDAAGAIGSGAAAAGHQIHHPHHEQIHVRKQAAVLPCCHRHGRKLAAVLECGEGRSRARLCSRATLPAPKPRDTRVVAGRGRRSGKARPRRRAASLLVARSGDPGRRFSASPDPMAAAVLQWRGPQSRGPGRARGADGVPALPVGEVEGAALAAGRGRPGPGRRRELGRRRRGGAQGWVVWS